MKASALCALYARICGAATLSGLVWGDSFDHWQGRLWGCLLATTVTLVVAGLVLRAVDRELAAFKLGMDVTRPEPTTPSLRLLDGGQGASPRT